jgi:tetratricopeptide (TPR) repeat protein
MALCADLSYVASTVYGVQLRRLPPPAGQLQAAAQAVVKRGLRAEEYAAALEGTAPSLKAGVELARAGKVSEAIAQFQTAMELPGVRFDARAEAQRLADEEQVKARYERATTLADEGKVSEALAAFREAVGKDPGAAGADAQREALQMVGTEVLLQVARDVRRGDRHEQAIAVARELDAVLTSDAHQDWRWAEDWNSICWFGSLWGKGKDVVFAGEHAVRLSPLTYQYKDTRGVARAQVGDFAGAIEDFKAYVAARGPDFEQREEWIKLLQARQNPFTPERLRELRTKEAVAH